MRDSAAERLTNHTTFPMMREYETRHHLRDRSGHHRRHHPVEAWQASSSL